jgi:glucose/arabinose dehydrogenase
VAFSPWVIPMPPPTATLKPVSLSFLGNGDEAEVVGEHVDVVVGRDRDGDLELARQVVLAVERLGVVGRLAARDQFLAQPDLVVGARARQKMLADAFGPAVDLVRAATTEAGWDCT